MAKTLLNGVNEVLKKVSIVSESNLLTSLTDSGKQSFIDKAVQAWNEAIDEVYMHSNHLKPNGMGSGTLTLVTNDRDYSLASDLIRLHFPLQDETNGQYIEEYPGGYERMRQDQPIPANHTGAPSFGAIRPDDGELYLDTLPTSEENGDQYTYIYEKELELSAATDTVPFSDAVFRAMVPVVTEIWKYYEFNESSSVRARTALLEKEKKMGFALKILNKTPPDDVYISRVDTIGFDPFKE